MVVLLIALVIIQFIRPAKNEETTVLPEDIAVLYPMSDTVQQILQRDCYDCHSNNSRYPWYYNIQPVAWWMNNHINDGKRELNFSEFGKRPLVKQVRKLRKTAHEILEGGMPLHSYLWIHKDAILNDADKQTLINWSTGLSEQIAAKLPDSIRAKLDKRPEPGHRRN